MTDGFPPLRAPFAASWMRPLALRDDELARAAELAATRNFLTTATFLVSASTVNCWFRNRLRLAHQRAGGRRQVDVHSGNLLGA